MILLLLSSRQPLNYIKVTDRKNYVGSIYQNRHTMWNRAQRGSALAIVASMRFTKSKQHNIWSLWIISSSKSKECPKVMWECQLLFWKCFLGIQGISNISNTLRIISAHFTIDDLSSEGSWGTFLLRIMRIFPLEALENLKNLEALEVLEALEDLVDLSSWESWGSWGYFLLRIFPLEALEALEDPEAPSSWGSWGSWGPWGSFLLRIHI